jgi:hypothetical protein
MSDIKKNLNNQPFFIDMEENVTYVIYPTKNINKKTVELPIFNEINEINEKKVDNILPYHINDLKDDHSYKLKYIKKNCKLVNILFIAFILLIVYEIIFFFSYQYCNKNDYLFINNYIRMLISLYRPIK